MIDSPSELILETGMEGVFTREFRRFLAIELPIEAQCIRNLPIRHDSVVNARAAEIGGGKVFPHAVHAGERDVLITKEFVLHTAHQSKLEVALVELIKRTEIPLFAKHETSSAGEEVSVPLVDPESRGGRVVRPL